MIAYVLIIFDIARTYSNSKFQIRLGLTLIPGVESNISNEQRNYQRTTVISNNFVGPMYTHTHTPTYTKFERLHMVFHNLFN